MNRRELLLSGASLAASATMFGSPAFAQQVNIAIATGGTGGGAGSAACRATS